MLPQLAESAAVDPRRRRSDRKHSRLLRSRRRAQAAQRHQLLPRVAGGRRPTRLARRHALVHRARRHRSVTLIAASRLVYDAIRDAI